MAGLAKPNAEGLGEEVVHELIDSYVKNSADGLFDGICSNEWDTNRVCYWNSTSSYITITTYGDCNMWRSGTSSWIDYSNPFIIHKKDKDGQFINITDGIVQNRENVTEKQWSKFISNLKAGTYKFVSTRLRLDSEWYLESTTPTGSNIPLSINKTLKANLPELVESNKDEIHFTEDGGIYINNNDGDLIQCNTGTIIKEISNPLTTSPLEYSQFKLSVETGELAAGDVVPFDVVVNGNMGINNGRVILKQGKTYEIDGSIFVRYSGNDGRATIWIKDLTNNINLGTASSAYATSTASYLRCNNISAKAIVTPETDIEIALVIESIYASGIKVINQNMSTLIVQEICNNPVNQYGGFEMETLFEGNGSVGEYKLSDNISNYDFLFVTHGMEKDTGSGSLIPLMTSNTALAPYVASASTENSTSKAKGAFDGVVGSGTNIWYSTTSYPQWLDIFLGSEATVSKFSLYNGSSTSGYHNYPPKSFIFQGSNNGTTYDDLLTVTDMAQMKQSEEVLFLLGNPVTYSHYRWNFTDGYNTSVIVGEAKLFGEHKSIEGTNIVIPNGKREQHIVVKDKSLVFTFNEDNMNIGEVDRLTIKKVIGVKGQLPSLLVGGEF